MAILTLKQQEIWKRKNIKRQTDKQLYRQIKKQTDGYTDQQTENKQTTGTSRIMAILTLKQQEIQKRKGKDTFLDI